MTLVLRVVVPLVLAMGGFAYLLLWTVESGVEERLQKDVELVARAIRLPVSYSLERNREGSVKQALESVFRIGRVYGAYVYDRNGDLIAAVGAVQPKSGADDLDLLVEGGRGTGEYQRIEGRKVFSWFVPLVASDGRINGILQVTRRQSDFANDINRLRVQALLLTLALTALLSGWVIFGHRAAIGRYLAGLVGSMARVESGDRDHRATVSGPREIAALAQALNAMLDGIVRAERELEARRHTQTQLEEQLRQAEKLAAIGRVAAGVAHELGTPLSTIDGKAQRGLREPSLDGNQRRTLEQIRHEVRRLSHIVRQLLDVGRVSGRERRSCSAGDLARSAMGALQDEFSRRGVSPAVVPPPVDLSIRVDPIRIEQALTNLLLNAAQASPGGRIRFGWSERDECVCFSVEDDGPGVGRENRTAIFEPFYTTKPVGDGSGLGLAVVHGVASEHQGRVEVDESELGGALFRLLIPVRRDVEESDGQRR